MRNSIKICLIAFVAILFTGSIFAQRDKKDFNREGRATKMTERLTEALSLDAAQAEKIKAIHLKYGVRMQADRSQEADDDQSNRRATRQQMHTDIDAEIKTVLTEDQYQKFQEMPKRGKGKGIALSSEHASREKGGKHHKKRKAFHNEKINPILLEQRAKLESKISVEDIATIAQLRIDIKKDRAEYKAERQEFRKSSEKKERPSREEMDKRKVERENNPQHIKLIALTEKYKADIEPLLAEVALQIKALKDEMREEMKGGKGEKGRKGGKGAEGHGKMEGKDKSGHLEKRENRKYAHFLLLDPNEAIKAEKRPGKSNSSIAKVKVYPNPSQGISRIEYELKTPGMISIELHDKTGNLIETIERAEKAAGNHEAAVNFSKYTVGIYYIVLKDANGGVISKKVIR
ncbi:MAG: hypothetical protein ACI8VT_001932 [Saprospiraceae bacterium]|jgi:hypothetical protein